MAELKTIITLRQGTTAEWASSPVILKQGEAGLEYCVDGSVKVKAGNDKDPWVDLPYIGGDVQAAIDAAADAAKQAAIDDAATKYTTTGALSDLETALDARLDTLEAIDHTLLATKAELEPIATAAANAETAVGNLESRFDEIVSVGGEPNAINKIQVNGSELTISNKTVNIEVPTALSSLEGWTILDGRLQTVEAFWKEALKDETDKNVIDTLKEIQEYIATDESGASAMAAKINEHTDRLDGIFIAANGETPASGMLVTEIARVEAKITTNEQAIAAINHSETGILAVANKYTDDQIAAIPVAGALLGLVKSSEDDNKIKVETDGTMSVNRISIDNLYVPENSELILSGGSAI